MSTGQTILVTGAGGFLGGAIARKLRARGDDVVGFQRGSYAALDALGVRSVKGDLADPAAVRAAVEGCDAVVHVAAKAGVWGPYDAYYQANTVGTQNIIAACQAAGVRRLVYTSTPSVVHAGGDLEGVDESAPYAEHFETAYPKTKALAEKAVLAANSAELSTVALRPHLIWGPGDNHLVPRILDRAKRGRLAFVGDGANLLDSVFVDNAADAHLLALDRLTPDAACAGKAYFISNGEPLRADDLVNRIVVAGGLPAVTRYVRFGLAYAIGAVLEVVFKILPLGEPPMTRFVARQLSTSHYYDLTAARRDLDYAPAISIDAGMQLLATALTANDARSEEP